ncbi:MAG: guanylate kinase [Ignavibacteriaceae bacterium]|nr:guanylate kinase [Ignavibacteriaceae bacterium]
MSNPAAQPKGKILVIAAPSGTGKTTILKQVLQKHPDIVFSVSATTRKKREAEVHGKDYYFISREEFEQKIAEEKFAEWERVYDYYYGTLKEFISSTIDQGKHILLELDVKGALSIKKSYPGAALIFIEPPSLEVLRERLTKRKTETEEDLAKRLNRAEMEISQKAHFEYHLVNSDIQKAVSELDSLISEIKQKGNE